MDNLNLINIDYLKKSYFKALLPLPEINEFLKEFHSRELESASKTLISLFDATITSEIIEHLKSTQDKQNFLRLIQEDYANPAILEFLKQVIPDVEQLIQESLITTLRSAKKVIL
jgi:hypothetical protein